MIDTIRFETIRNQITGAERQRQGIGTLSEKTVHAVLKNYYAPDPDTHEVPVEGYVADVYENGSILEIQTRNFNKLRDKLDRFLPLYSVTVIYPIPASKWLVWIDEETGEFSKRHKSPKQGSIYDIIPELYKIQNYLKHPNFHLRIAMLDMEEQRLLNGWSRDRKRGSYRYDRIPLALVGEYAFTQIEDYMQLIPISVPDRFTSRDYAKAAHTSVGMAQTALRILYNLELIRRVGKSGRMLLYEVNEDA